MMRLAAGYCADCEGWAQQAHHCHQNGRRRASCRRVGSSRWDPRLTSLHFAKLAASRSSR